MIGFIVAAIIFIPTLIGMVRYQDPWWLFLVVIVVANITAALVNLAVTYGALGVAAVSRWIHPS